jgi:SNF2 family DNA or RNA helicase
MRAPRHDLQTQFQDDPNTHAAVLSITACGVGLNLTSASIAVFVELHWVPGQIFQVGDEVAGSCAL